MDTSLNVMSPGPKDTRRPTGLSRQLGIFDLVVEAGNPADSERPLPMLERHIARNGETLPRSLMPQFKLVSRSQRG